MNERWEKIERLYHAARELDQDLQARFIDEACRSDLEMRRQIDDLLKQDREQSSFLDTPAVEFAAELPEKAAHVIGRCLELDPEARWQSAIDLKQELTWAASIGSTSVSPRTRQSMRWIAGISIVSLILFGAFTWLLINKQSRTTDALHCP